MFDYIVPIITSAIMANSFTTSTPALTLTPSQTYKDSYSVEVNGKENSRVFLNGVEVAILKSNGKVYIDLDTSGAYGTTKEFRIILKNANNQETQTLIFFIDKVEENGIENVEGNTVVKFGTITSEVTGKVWMDRNLGALEVCDKSRSEFSARDVYVGSQKRCLGDYYQWGRATDGHEKYTSTSLMIQSSDTTPSHKLFVKGYFDWTSADSNGTSRSSNWNICPSGYRVPTQEEISAEKIINIDDAHDRLKIPTSGYRYAIRGVIKGDYGTLWSASPSGGSSSRQLSVYKDTSFMSGSLRAMAVPVRCLQDPTLGKIVDYFTVKGDYSSPEDSTPATIQSGVALHDILSNSIVCIDSSESGTCSWNGILSVTDTQGNFELEFTEEKGTLVAEYGGVEDVVQNGVKKRLDFKGALSAPYGSKVITPLTSLIDSLIKRGNTLEEADRMLKHLFKLDEMDDSNLLTNYNHHSAMNDETNTDAQRALGKKVMASQLELNSYVLTIASAIIFAAEDGGSARGIMKSVYDKIAFEVQRDGKLPDIHETSLIIKMFADNIYHYNGSIASLRILSEYIAKRAIDESLKIREMVMSSQDIKKILYDMNTIYLRNIEHIVQRTKLHFDNFERANGVELFVTLQREETLLIMNREEAIIAFQNAKAKATRLERNKADSVSALQAYVEANAVQARAALALAEAESILVESETRITSETLKIVKDTKDVSDYVTFKDKENLKSKTKTLLNNIAAFNDNRVAEAILQAVEEAVLDGKTIQEIEAIQSSTQADIQEKIDKAQAEIDVYVNRAQGYAMQALEDANEAREIADYYMRGETKALETEKAAMDAQRAASHTNIIISQDYDSDDAMAYMEEAEHYANIAAEALASMAYIKTNADIVLENGGPTRKEAIKLLRQGSYSSYETQIDYIMKNGEMAWIDDQLAMMSAHDSKEDTHYGYLESLMRIQSSYLGYQEVDIHNPEETYPECININLAKEALVVFYRTVFPKMMFDSEDQLRHRMALALNEIVVVSVTATAGPALYWRPEGLVKLYDELYKHSFGNYRDVLKSASMSSAMAYYLTFHGNKKENENSAPDENYARELMQLFSIGVYELNIDGTKELDVEGNPIPSYTQEDVSQLSRVFTGWDWWSNRQCRDWGTGYGKANTYVHNMIHDNQFSPRFHEYGEKFVLGTTIDADLSGEADIDAVIDILMDNKNMAPHVSRHLIMRLVTSNPTPEYIERVAIAFNTGLYDGVGTGEKGDLKATVEAIMKDPEARGISEPENFGKTDEYILAFTHYASRLNVSPMPWNSVSRTRRYDYYSSDWYTHIAHLPLGASSVFNHYSNEDAPSSEYFISNSLVAPELASYKSDDMQELETLVNERRYDKYEVVDLGFTELRNKRARTMEEWLDWEARSGALMFDSEDIYKQFMPLWAPNFNTWNRNTFYSGNIETRHNAVRELIDILALKFLGEKLADDYKELIFNQIVYIDPENPSAEDNDKTRRSAQSMVRRVTNFIILSPQYMTLD